MSERRIFFYELEVGSRSKRAQPPPLQQIAEMLLRRMKSGQQIHTMRKGEVAVALGDLEVDANAGVMRALIRLGDMTLPDAVYSGMTDATFRHIPKATGEYTEVGAHLVVSLKPNPKKPHNYLLLLEGVRRLSHYQIKRLLNEILSKEYEETPTTFTYPDPSGGTRRFRHRPTIEFRGILSSDLIEQLDKGRIVDVTLLHDLHKQPLGPHSFLIRRQQKLSLSVDKGFVRNRWDRMKSAFKSLSKEYEGARIRFLREDDRTPGTVYVNTDDGTAQQIKYLKSTVLTGILPPLAESSQRIAQQLMKPMEQLLNDGV